MKLLIRSGFRYYRKNLLQLVLSIVGIALGVAVVIAIDLANSSAIRGFDLSMETISGKATHQIRGNEFISDTLLRFVKNKFQINQAAPVIEKFVKLNVEKPITLTFLGLDPFSEKHFRDYFNNDKIDFQSGLVQLMTNKNSVIINNELAKKYNLKAGDSIPIEIDGKAKKIYLSGIINLSDANQQKLTENLILADIAVAQDLFEIKNKISRIDIIIDDKQLSEIQNSLPIGVSISEADSRSSAGKDMTESFRTNLTAMSLLSIIVGMFLIYNTMTFSVVQRRKYLGLLRSIGVTNKEIFRLILSESIILGLSGTILGIIAGIFLGNFLISLVTKTINDMYFVLQVQDVNISALSLLKGIFLGLIATIFSAIKPAREAANVPAGVSLIRSIVETNITEKSNKMLIYGLIFIALGIGFLFLPIKNIYISYVGMIPLMIGFSLITPKFIIIMIDLMLPIYTKLFGSIGKMSARGIKENLSRTTISIAALSIALSAAIGIGTMVSSFRQTVVDWLNYRLNADIYASVPTNVSRFNDGAFPEWVIDSAKTIEGVHQMNIYRELQINHNGKIYHLLASKVQPRNYEKFSETLYNTETVWEKFREEEVLLVSESYAFKNNVGAGDSLTLPTDRGYKTFQIIAVYYDYSSDIGLILMNMEVFRKYFNDKLYSGIGLFVSDSTQIDKVAQELKEKTSNLNMIVRSNKNLIDTSVEVFDRTFVITNVLQLLAIVVSFIGIFSAMMALQLEKSRQFAILRANGLTPIQLWKHVIYQTGLMGFVSGLLAMPLGLLIAYILINIINTRSFGWSISFYFEFSYLFEAIIVGIFSAILAGIYPAYKMANTAPAISLRNE